MKRVIISQPLGMGGPGSGNWGHAGRPGQRGGSQSNKSVMSIKSGGDWLARYEQASGKPHPLAQTLEAARKSVRDKPIELSEVVAIGGNEWQKGNYHRVYFNYVGHYYGIETGRYNTGNISSATLNGMKISNSEAKRLLNKINTMKFWFDVNDGRFHYKWDTGWTKQVEAEDFAKVIFAAIREEIYQNRERGR